MQDLLRIDVDCDRDSLKFVVHQHGAGFCHLDTRCVSRNRRTIPLPHLVLSHGMHWPISVYTVCAPQGLFRNAVRDPAARPYTRGPARQPGRPVIHKQALWRPRPARRQDSGARVCGLFFTAVDLIVRSFRRLKSLSAKDHDINDVVFGLRPKKLPFIFV
jgi:hypothetical protein